MSMQLEFFDVPSPCIGICQTDDKGLCKGCFRSRDERQTWIHLTSDDKQKVIKRCQQRKRRKENGIKPKAEELVVNVVQPSLLDQPNKPAICTKDAVDFGDFEL
ncbi:DUF1289 domain-containing protein [Thalassotalea profundi]|uniref:DUF1289 domain-containing protein n=1 Tax=Thalassotalea profundi TaxID=2036687 RepID=A0ABQ3INL1_9GAMM|nr:DUF1289 domain-containing protein [Thalassotalea profundi]GHE86688.1 DUF1289 domain-containing protein [Thalassotalea profundi]